MIQRQRRMSQPQQRVGVHPRWAGAVRKLLLPQGNLGFWDVKRQMFLAAGSSLVTGITREGWSVACTTGADLSNITSAFSISLGTRPSSATFLAVAQRAGFVSATGIPYIVNCRSETETNYYGFELGNRYSSAGSKNKITVESVGGTVTSLWLNGANQTLATTSDAETASNTPMTVASVATSLTGSSYELFAKTSATSNGFRFPLSLMMFAELDVLSDSAVAVLSANPWSLFAPIERRIWIPAYSVVPTLSNPTVSSITGTTVRPGVKVIPR